MHGRTGIIIVTSGGCAVDAWTSDGCTDEWWMHGLTGIIIVTIMFHAVCLIMAHALNLVGSKKQKKHCS